MPKILFVPISIVGCGKSTVFRTLRQLAPGFVHIENDNFDNKPAFYNAIRTALSDSTTVAVLLDRNNHLRMHRREILNKFKAEGVLIVALLFVPKSTSAQQMRSLVLDRIASRGDNHQQVKGESDFGKAKMIVNSFVKNFAPFNPSDAIDSQFDHVIDMDTGKESSEENVRRIANFCNEIFAETAGESEFISIDETQISQALQSSLAFQVGKDDATIEPGQ
ncbi:hypothetical protein OXX59_005229 [Metschnikowia pulcherrima]